MAQEARSHLYIKPSEDDKSVHQNATADVQPAEVAELQRLQTDDQDGGYAVEAVKPELRERRCFDEQSPSHVDKKYTSRKHHDRREVNRIHYQHDAARAGQQEANQTSKEKPSTVVSSQNLSSDDHLSKLKKSKDKEMTRAETSGSPGVSRREKHKKSRNTTDIQQWAREKPTAEGSETNLKKLSRSKHETEVPSHRSSESRPSNVKSTDHKVKSITVKPSDRIKTETAGRNSSSVGSSCPKSSGTKSDEEISRIILNSFDEVFQVSRD